MHGGIPREIYSSVVQVGMDFFSNFNRILICDYVISNVEIENVENDDLSRHICAKEKLTPTRSSAIYRLSANSRTFYRSAHEIRML